MAIETDKVHRIKDMSSLLAFLSGELGWELPSDAAVDEMTYDWTGTELHLEDKLSGKLKGGVVRQLKPMRNGQPWGIFLLEYDGSHIPVTALRQILRRFVVKRYQTNPDMPAFLSPNMLFICSGNNGEFTFAHFYGEKPQQARLTTFGWSPNEPIRTLCEINLPAMKYDFNWKPEQWLKEWQSAFDVEKVTDRFFEEYLKIFGALQKLLYAQAEKQESDKRKAQIWAHDYALQFLNRLMFLYFIQKKRWLGDNSRFIRHFWDAYSASNPDKDSFFKDWLSVLFFEAFNNKYQNRHEYIERFGAGLNDALNKAPFLNGGLFTPNELDTSYKVEIPDSFFETLFDEYNGKQPGFFESYNFTISETTPLDQEVAVDPEMTGKVYERLVNLTFEGIAEEDQRGSAGIFYTPRVEIDLMCRLSLVDYLANHLGQNYKGLLYAAVFAYSKEDKDAADNRLGAKNLWGRLDGLFKEITVCDPACGSGSFLIGMLLVLDDFMARCEAQLGSKQLTQFQRRKEIIANSLYGVDVMPWAVHVAELRLWLQLVVDSEIKWYEHKSEPMLPNLSFKVRPGDSLVQEVGGISFGTDRHQLEISSSLKGKLTALKGEKLKFYRNDPAARFKKKELLEMEELNIFREILREKADGLQRGIAARNMEIEHMQTRGAFAGMEPIAIQAPLEIEGKKREVSEYQKELDSVRKALEVLNRNKAPFIWNIGFVEIFEGDKQGFDIVIGNPPYVRQEKIEAPEVNGVQVTGDKREYKAKLARSVYQSYPRFFGYKPREETVTHKLDAKSDLYIYFYFRGLKLLNPNGVFCFITSNSWLDANYGADLQEFLLKHAHVRMVLDNQARRTFAHADVNSVIVLLSAPDDKRAGALDRTARFAMFRVPFEYIMSPVIFDEIEEATERKATREYRVFPILQNKLLEDGCELPEDEEDERLKPAPTGLSPLIKVARYVGNKWGGKYLRAPDIFYRLRDVSGGCTVSLGQFVRGQRYLNTGGANGFFIITKFILSSDGLHYLVTNTSKEGREDSNPSFLIEREFTHPIIRSSDLSTLWITASQTDALVIDIPPDETAIKHTKALEYIRWGERKEFNKRSVTSLQRPWWKAPIQARESGPLLWLRYHHNVHRAYYNPQRLIGADAFYRLYPFDDSKTLPLAGILNSTYIALWKEILGAVGYGLGVLGTRMDSMLRVPVPYLNDSGFCQQLTDEFKGVAFRPIEPIVLEKPKIDRRALDDCVFEYLGLTTGERDAVYEAVINLVEARLKKAGSV